MNMKIGKLLGAVMLASAAVGHAQAEDITLSFPSWQAEEAGFSDWWKAAIKEFEAKNPGVKINLEQIAFPNYVNEVTTRFAAGNPPDILLLGGDAVGGFASQGWLDPLDDRAAGTPLADKNWSTLQEAYKWDGKTIGVLILGYGDMMFYNEQLLKDAGVAVPTSFKEFGEAVKKITNRDKGIFGIAGVTQEYPTIVNDFTGFVRWHGNELVKDGKYNLTDPGVIEAMQNYRDVMGKNSPPGLNNTLARQLFLDGKAAFLVDGPWVNAMISTAKDDMKPNLKMVAPPFDPKLGGAANSLHVPASLPPERKELVWKFITMLMQPEWQRQYLLNTSSPPGMSGVLNDQDLKDKPYLGEVAKAAAGAENIIPTIQSIQANVNEYSDILTRLAVRVLTTDDPIDGLAKDAQAELEAKVPLK